MKTLILILILFSSLVHAADEWRCTDDSTTRSGDVWMACGTGEGNTESEARKDALKAALSEFVELCRLSTGCMERDRSVEPKRQTCAQQNNTGAQGLTLLGVYAWKCYRLVEITLH